MENIINHLVFSLSREKDISRLFMFLLGNTQSPVYYSAEYIAESPPFLSSILSRLGIEFKHCGMGNNFKLLKKHSSYFTQLILTPPEMISLKSEKLDFFLGSFLFSSQITQPLAFLRAIKGVLKSEGKLLLLEKEQSFWEKIFFSFSNLDVLKNQEFKSLLLDVFSCIEYGKQEVLRSGCYQYSLQLPYFLKLIGFKKVVNKSTSVLIDLTPPYKEKDKILLSFLKNGNFSRWLEKNRENYFFGSGNATKWNKFNQYVKELEDEIKNKIAEKKLLLSFSTGVLFFLAQS
jgi:ubiquinone/menaquinone biosynthesis C-methylase UbiE